MKIKNLKFNSEMLSYIISGAIVLSLVGADIVYYCCEDKHQVCEEYSNADDNDIFIDDNGNYCKNFDVGEHVIKISRNDAYFHDYDEVDGYTIKNVEIRGWRDNSKVVYVNTKPVTAIGKINSDGDIAFNDFGTVQENTKNK